VTHADAGEFFKKHAKLSQGKAYEGFSCVALDAYDGEGLVPVHLQAAPFLRDVVSCLSPGGMIICNLFNGEPGQPAGIRLEAFIARLKDALGKGGRVTRLAVEGQEMNVIVQAYRS